MTQQPSEQLHDVIGHALEQLPPQPTSRINVALPLKALVVCAHFDYYTSATGQLEFGSDYEVRTLNVEPFEVMYAAGANKPSSIVVSTFDRRGMVDHRTWFKPSPLASIAKQYELEPRALDPGVGFWRELEAEEVRETLLLLDPAAVTAEGLTKLLTLTTAEQTMLERSMACRAERERKFIQGLKEIEAAEEQAAAIDMSGIILR